MKILNAVVTGGTSRVRVAGGCIERWVEGPADKSCGCGSDLDGIGGRLAANPVLRSLGSGPLRHVLLGGIEVGDSDWARDSADVEDGMLGFEGDLANGVIGDGCVGRDVVVDIECKIVDGLAVERFIADKGVDCDHADCDG